MNDNMTALIESSLKTGWKAKPNNKGKEGHAFDKKGYMRFRAEVSSKGDVLVFSEKPTGPYEGYWGRNLILS